jgi:hypothetical protein
MLAIGMLAAAAGLVLGLRFSLITLILLTMAIVITFATSVLGGSSSLAVGTQMLATLASIQISYLFGCLLAAHLPVRSSSERSEARLWCVAGRELGKTTSDKELVRAPALPPGKRQGHIPFGISKRIRGCCVYFTELAFRIGLVVTRTKSRAATAFISGYLQRRAPGSMFVWIIDSADDALLHLL